MVKSDLIYTMSTSNDLTTLSLQQLKKMAMGRRIKKYYILPKAQLIELLTMPELPDKYRIEKMTIIELREIAKKRDLRGFWSMSKNELTRMLFPEHNDVVQDRAAHEKKQDNGEAGKHEDPQRQDPENVRVQVVENAGEQGLDDMKFNVGVSLGPAREL